MSRGIILWFSAYKVKRIICYKVFLFTTSVCILIWNIFLLVIFSFSAKDWKSNSSKLYAASIIIAVQSCYSVLMCCSAFCMLLTYFLSNFFYRSFNRRSPNVILIQNSCYDCSIAHDIISKLERLKANNLNFTSGEDLWCICMDPMFENENVVFLPCHANHCMHYDWISEWIMNDSRCPICKQSITIEKIQETIDQMNQHQNECNDQELFEIGQDIEPEHYSERGPRYDSSQAMMLEIRNGVLQETHNSN